VKRSGVLRILLWLAAGATMLVAGWRGDAGLGAAAALLVLLAIAVLVPPALRVAVAAIAGIAIAALWLGGPTLLFDLLPALIAALVGWMFARTLLPARRPLIARAVAAIDGEDWLERAAVARYARRLTVLWAGVQAALTALGLVCALHARGLWPALAAPSPRAFGAIILPAAVAGVFVLEFVLRRVLLPEAPRHGLVGFLVRLARSWPRLLD
jgi:hypothetical protein